MTHVFDQALLTKARELGPVLREHGAVAERDRRPPKQMLDALNRSGITKMLLPKSLGGLETDPLTAMRVAEEVASFDAIAGWVVMVANGHAFTAARFSAEVAEELFKDPNDWMGSAAFQPPVEAREVEGGYRLTGQRALASFAHTARWVTVTGLVMDGPAPRIVNGRPVLIIAIMDAKGVEVIDTWQALGMRGTDSADVSVKDLFVPKTFTCPLVPPFEPNKHYRAPLYRLPMLATIVLATIPPVAVAIARRAIDEVKALSAKRVPMGSAVPLAERGVAQARLGRAEAMLRSARAFMYETMAETWEKTQAGAELTAEERARVLLAAAHASQVGAEVTDLMFTSGGSSALYARSPLERLFRDAQVIRQHGFVAASRYETAAQVMLGLEADLPLLHF